MHERLPKAVVMDDDPDDRPFRMTALSRVDLDDVQERPDSLNFFAGGARPSARNRSRVFTGICLALPLSFLIWYLVFHGLRFWVD